MFNLITILTIILFYITFVFLVVFIKKKNNKYLVLFTVFIVLTIIIFFIWGILRNLNITFPI